MTARQALAASLIGTRTVPAGLKALQGAAAEALAYHRLNPYPACWFRDWKTEDRGPLPRCLPLARSVVMRGARFLFGKPLGLTCAGNERWEKFVAAAWAQNNMPARLVPIAAKGGLESGVVLKFAYDETADRPLSIQTLSIVHQVRLFHDPHDRDCVLMARVQYPYQDPASGKTFWYREEWTAEEEVHYAPLAVSELGAARFNPDTSDQWVESGRAANPFGLIPLCYIKNLETDDAFGALDLADLYRVLDNIHLTYHLMNRSNQFDADTNPIFIDADLDEQDVDKPLQPGQPIDLHSEQDSEHQAKVVFPSGGNGLRPAMMEYAKDLKRQVLAGASSVEVDQSEFTNKGNLTVAVLEQLYQPQIEITEEKRKSWGGGIVAFLALVAKGLTNAGADLGVNVADEDSYRVALHWPPYFPMSEDEKTAKTGRLQEQEIAGYLPHERAIEEVSAMEGRDDVKAIKDELAKEPRPTPTEQDPNVQNMENEVKGLQRVGGDDAK